MLPKKIVAIHISICMLLCALIAGCGGGHNTTAPAALGAGDTGSTLNSLPSPAAALLRMGSAAGDAAYQLWGRQYEAGLSQRLGIEGDCGRFSPDWTREADEPEGLAYGIYGFNLTGYAGSATFSVAWADAPLTLGNAWLGFSNWQQGAWKWYACPAGGTLALPQPAGLEPYIKPDTGEMLVALVMVGQDEGVLYQCGVQQESGCESWPVFGHDPQHTGRSTLLGPDSSALKWKFHTYGSLYSLSSPVAGADGTIYISNYHGTIYTVEDGGILSWFARPDILTHTSSGLAVGPDGTIYMGVAQSGEELVGVAAVAPDGTTRWIYRPVVPGLWTGTPAVAADGSICFVADGYLYILNSNGTLRSKTGDGIGDSSPVVIGPDGSIYIQPGNYVEKFDHEGTFCWQAGTAVLGTSYEFMRLAAADDGTVYMCDQTFFLTALDDQGNVLWKSSEVYFGSQPEIGNDGTVYISGYVMPTHELKLFAVNPDGTIKWQNATGECGTSPCIGSDGLIYYADTHLRAVNADGVEQLSVPLTGLGSGMILEGADGRLHVKTVHVLGLDHTSLINAVDRAGFVAWSVGSGGAIESAGEPVIGEDQTIYFGANDCRVYAMNPDGTEKWHYDNDEYFRSALTVTPENKVFAVDNLGSLHALDADGSLLWSYDPGYSTTGLCAPLVQPDGTICFGNWGDTTAGSVSLEADGRLQVINPDGSLKWEHTFERPIWMVPSVDAAGTLFVTSVEGDLHCFDPEGTVLWENPLTGYAYCMASPLTADNTVYLALDDGLKAVAGDGSALWSQGAQANTNGAPAIGSDGTVYYSERTNPGPNITVIRAIKPDGSELWTSDVEILDVTALTLDGAGCIYAGSSDGKMYVFNPDGSLKMSLDTGHAQQLTAAVIGADRTVYFGSTDGYLYAFGG